MLPGRFLALFAVISFIALRGSLAGTSNYCEDESYRRFVGLSGNKALFAIMVTGNWDYVANYCHQYRMIAAKIDYQEENDMVANYLNRSADINSFWLPATDYISEGTFAWVQTKAPLTYSNWAEGFPSVSRTRNCVAIQKDGRWIEERCDASHYGLCAIPLLERGPSSLRQEPSPGNREQQLAPVTKELPLEHAKETRVVPIGEVGSKAYYKNETPRNFPSSLDYCHVLGMRMVSPETPEEFQFLLNYSLQMQEEGKNTYILTSGTDMLATGCNRGNAVYRWFYSAEEIQEDWAFASNWWYKCLVIYPVGVGFPDCFSTGWPTYCELNSAA